MTRRTRWGPSGETLLVATLCCLVALGYALTSIVPHSTPEFTQWVSGDLYTLYLPIQEHGVDAIREGRLPTWNPYQGLGVPFLATGLVGLFYPVKFFQYLLSTPDSLALSALLHLGLAGLFTYLFLRRSLSLGTVSSLLGALVFQLSGAVVREIWWPSILEAMVWLPALLLLTDRLLRRPRLGTGLAWSAALACQILTGGLYLVVHTAYTVAAWAAAWTLPRLGDARERRRALRGWGALGAAIAGALALSAAQWLPTARAVLRATRSFEGLDIAEAEPFPELFGPGAILGSFVHPGASFPTFAFVGLLPLLLAAAAFLDRSRRRQVLFFAGWGVVTLLLACGSATPVFPWFFQHFPTGSWFRVPARFLWLPVLCVAILAAVGVEGLGNRLRAVPKLPTPFRLLPWLLLLVATANLVAANVQAVYPHPALQDEANPLGARLAERLGNLPGHERSYLWSRDHRLTEKFGSRYDLPVVNDYETLSDARLAELVARLAGEDSARRFQGIDRLEPRPGTLRLFDLLSVRWVVEDPPGPWVRTGRGTREGTRRGTRRIDSVGRLALLERSTALPRAYLVERWEVLPGPVGLERLADPAFDPRTTVILDRRPGPPPSGDGGGAGPAEAGTSEPRVEIVELSPSAVAVGVSSPRGGVLVLTDLWDDEWRVLVNDRPAPLLRANHAVRATRLAAGSSRVRFVYRPVWLRVGLAVSTAAVLVWLTLVAATLRPAARRGRATGSALD